MEEKTSEIQEQNEDSTEAPKSFDSSKWKPVEIDEAEIDKIVNSPIDQVSEWLNQNPQIVSNY
jgi:hypothetical protein